MLFLRQAFPTINWNDVHQKRRNNTAFLLLEVPEEPPHLQEGSAQTEMDSVPRQERARIVDSAVDTSHCLSGRFPQASKDDRQQVRPRTTTILGTISETPDWVLSSFQLD